MGLVQSTAPVSEPVPIDDLRDHLRIDDSEDIYVQTLARAAREWCEMFTRRQFVDATYQLTLDEFSDAMELPRPPLDSVTSIAYIDEDGNSQILDSSIYSVDTGVEPGLVRLAYNQSWPAIRSTPNAVTITYIAGYGGPVAVPAVCKHAIKLLVGHWYENREDVVVSDRVRVIKVPTSVETLLWAVRTLVEVA